MRSRFRDSMMILSTAAVVAAVFWLAVRPTASQGAAYRAPRTAAGKPDLNGIWQALNTANWDIQDHAAQPGPFPFLLGAVGAVPAGQGVVEGNEIPYQPAAAAKKKENFETRLTVPLLESGCHEGNYASINTLSGVRNLEKDAAEAAKKGK